MIEHHVCVHVDRPPFLLKTAEVDKHTAFGPTCYNELSQFSQALAQLERLRCCRAWLSWYDSYYSTRCWKYRRELNFNIPVVTDIFRFDLSSEVSLVPHRFIVANMRQFCVLTPLILSPRFAVTPQLRVVLDGSPISVHVFPCPHFWRNPFPSCLLIPPSF